MARYAVRPFLTIRDMIKHYALNLPSKSRGFHLITNEVVQCLGDLPSQGLLHIFIHHTSAGLTINENADPDMRTDLNAFMNHLVPENMPFVIHTMEGPDDMPAHVKATLVGPSVSIPIVNGQLHLGTWQGIYLCEFRTHARPRSLTLTLVV